MTNDPLKAFGFATQAIRTGHRRTHEGEHSEPVFATSSYVFGSAAEAAARFSGDEPGNIYSRFTNPTVRTFEQRIAALEGDQSCVADMNAVYQNRRDVLVQGLKDLGLTVEKPQATFYVWIENPAGYSSVEFASRLLSEAGIVVTPGNGFGAAGEGYVRMALTVNAQRLQEVIARIRRIGF